MFFPNIFTKRFISGIKLNVILQELNSFIHWEEFYLPSDCYMVIFSDFFMAQLYTCLNDFVSLVLLIINKLPPQIRIFVSAHVSGGEMSDSVGCGNWCLSWYFKNLLVFLRRSFCFIYFLSSHLRAKKVPRYLHT